MNMFLVVVIYLILGLLFIVPLGRRGALTVTKDNRWALLWFIWPLAFALLVYALINTVVLVLVKWNDV